MPLVDFAGMIFHLRVGEIRLYRLPVETEHGKQARGKSEA